MSRDLPESPNLDHLRKQSKLLLRELQRLTPTAKLTDAQRVIARQYGFASWQKLRTHVESLRRSRDSAQADRTASWRGGGGMFWRYTEPARRALFFARYQASQFGSATIETEHLLLGVVREDPKLTKRLLPDESSTESILERIQERTTLRKSISASLQLPLSTECKRVLGHTADQADRLGHENIGTGHLLLGILSEEGSLASSILTEVLTVQGKRLETARDDIVQFMTETLE